LSAVPARYRPETRPADFIVEPGAGPDDRIDVGLLFIGGGPAGLAGAIRFSQLLETAPDLKARLGDTPVAVVEKGKYPGAHLVSGAVVNPIAFKALFPDLAESDFPFRSSIRGEAVYYMTAGGARRIPTPPTMKNHGYFSASISEMARWLAGKAEALGVMMLSETTAAKLLMQGGVVHGVLSGDKGQDRDGSPLSNHEPGVEIHGRATVLCEGVTAHLTMALTEQLGIGGENPQIYALGVKEIWDVPTPLDRVIHTMGWPLRAGKTWREFGGSFIYPLGDSQVSIGMVAGLDAADSTLSVHDLLQEFKQHPMVREILKGGKRNEQGWGAKTIPEGGFYALPKALSVRGAMITGDAAGFVNVPALKGIHYAMMSGIYAAEAAFAALEAGRDLREAGALDGYDAAVRNSFIWSDLHKVRNMRQAFGEGFIPGVALAGMMTVTGGLFPGWRFGGESDAEHPVMHGGRSYPRPDGVLTFDKLSSVYASGNRTRDTQPNHIQVRTDVPQEVGDAWINMCPAAVYEWGRDAGGKPVLLVNAPNCVQCGAITGKGGRLTPPEGGSGPEYTLT